jgi:hypothetical protein
MDYARSRARGFNSYSENACMRKRAAQECRVQHAWELNIVDEAASTLQQGQRIRTRERRADISLRMLTHDRGRTSRERR